MENNIQQIEEEELDIGEYIAILLKHIWLILGVMIFGIVVAVMVNIFTRPQYKSAALIMIDKENSGYIDTINRSYSGEEDYYRTQYKLLTSRTILEKVFDKLNLADQEQFQKKTPRSLAKYISVAPVLRSRLVNLEATTYDPQFSADLANAIAEQYVEDNVNSRITMGKDVIKALEESEKSNKKQKEMLYSLPQVVNSSFIKDLKKNLNELTVKEAGLLAKYTPQHPEVQALRQQIDTISNRIERETNRIIQSLKIELSGQFSANNVRIIDKALPEPAPVSPRKKVNLAIGAFAGLMLGMLISLLMEFMDQSIKNSDELEKKLHLPFLGQIPFDKNRDRTKHEFSPLTSKVQSVATENIRNIRTMTYFAMAENHNAPLLITSAFQSEGKSYLSVNLAVAIAQTNKKVLLIDGDMRRGQLHRTFFIENNIGLSNIWTSDPAKSKYENNVHKIDTVENLYVMTCGKRPPNPAELLNTPKLKDLVQWAVDNFDQVIIDCPATMPVSDTMLWGRYIDKAVFVVKCGETNAKAAELAINQLRKAGIKILGVILSFYKREGLSYYGKYSYNYKHSYNYSYYTDDEGNRVRKKHKIRKKEEDEDDEKSINPS